MNLLGRVTSAFNGLKTDLQNRLSNWATQNPGKARAVLTYEPLVRAVSHPITTARTNLARANIRTPQQFVSRVVRNTAADLGQLNKQVLQPYVSNLVTNRLKSAGVSYLKSGEPGISGWERTKRLGSAGLDTAYALFNLTPAGLRWQTYNAAKSQSAAKLGGKTFPEQTEAFISGLTGETPFTGAGSALTTNKPLEQALNVGEVAALVGYGLYQGWKYFKNWNDLRLKTKILRDTAYAKDLNTLQQYGFQESDFGNSEIMKSKLMQVNRQFEGIGKLENQSKFHEFMKAFNKMMDNYYEGVPKINVKTTTAKPTANNELMLSPENIPAKPVVVPPPVQQPIVPQTSAGVPQTIQPPVEGGVRSIQPPTQNFTPPTTDMVSQIAYQNTVKNGGVTINLKGVQPTEGYAYAPSKNTEVKIEESKFSIKDVNDFKAKNAELLKDPNNHLGFWKENGIIYMDVSRVGPPTPETIAAAKAADQLAVFDLKNFKSIYTKDYETINSLDISGKQNLGTVVPGNTGSTQEIQRGGEKVTTTTSPTAGQEVISPTNFTPLGQPPPPIDQPLPGQKERGLVESIRENPANIPEVRAGVSGFYDVTTDRGRIDYGNNYIKQNYQKAINRVLSNEPISNELQGIGYALFKDLQNQATLAKNAGRITEYEVARNQAIEVAIEMAKRGTITAQSLQFFHLWSHSSPEGMIAWAESIYEQANQFHNMNLKRMGLMLLGQQAEINITPEMEKMIRARMADIQMISDDKARAQATKDLMKTIVDPIPTPALAYINAFRYNNALSGLRTQLRNITGNAVNVFVLRPAQLLIEDGENLIRRSLGQKTDTNKINIYIKGLIGSMGAARQSFFTTLKNIDTMQLGKRDMGADDYYSFHELMRGRVPKYLKTSGVLLQAVDNFFETMVVNAEKMRLMSLGEDEIRANHLAKDLADKLLYHMRPTKKNIRGEGWIAHKIDLLSLWAMDARKMVPFGDQFALFVNVPMQVLKMGLEMHPVIGLINAATSTNKEYRRWTWAMWKLGLVVASLGGVAALTGNYTWDSPTDPDAKTAFYDAGHRRYSFGLTTPFGKYDIPMYYLGPLAIPFSMMPAIMYYFKDSPTALTDSTIQKVAKVITSSLQLWSQSTPLSGIGGLVRNLQGDIDYNAANNLSFTAGQYVPWNALLGDISHAVDPVLRKPKGFIEGLFRNIPFFTKTMAAYTTAWGEEVKRNWSDYIAPYTIGKIQPTLEATYQGQRILGQQSSEANFYKKMAEREVDDSISNIATASTSGEDALKKQKQNLDKLFEAYDTITDENIRTRIKESIEKRGVNFEDAYENYLTKDTQVHQEGLSETTRVALERSNEFTYVRKLRNQYDGTGVGGDFLQKEMQRKNITEEDLNYDDATALTDDLQLQQIKDTITGLSGEELISELVAMRRVSEGTRKALLTDTLINKLVKEGVISDSLGESLKQIGWNSKLKDFTTISGGAGGGKKLKLGFRTSVPSAPSVKVAQIPKFNFPTGLKSLKKSSSRSKFVTPKIPTSVYTPTKLKTPTAKTTAYRRLSVPRLAAR